MTAEDGNGLDTATMRALAREYRRLADELESRAAQAPAASEEPAESRRTQRVVRNEMRRAARNARRLTDTVWVVRPHAPENEIESAGAQQVAHVRRRIWHRSEDAVRAMEAGDVPAARQALAEVLRAEEALQVSMGEVSVPAAYGGALDLAGAASDTVIAATRDQLAALDHSPVDREAFMAAAARARGGQSNWLRSWRSLALVVPD